MKATFCSITSTIAVAIFAPTFASAAIISSDFSTGLDGWTGVDLPYNTNGPYTNPVANFTPSWISSGGNPGGYIDILDPTADVFYFQAPAAFLGNKSSAYGGVLEFDVRSVPLDGNGFVFDDEPDVVLVGGGFTLVANIGTAPTPGIWTHFTASLTEAGGWRQGSLTGASVTAAQFQNTLSSLSALRIRGEFVNGGDRGDLDNAAIVPEPTSGVLLASAALLCAMRRRKQ